jgi:hypothetical protein
MTDNVIELINVSKRYLLGEHLRTGRSLRETVAGLVHRRGAPRAATRCGRYVT